MTSGDRLKGAGVGRFQTTQWSVVVRAGGPAGEENREALARLCERYWPPVYAYIRRRVATEDEAQDLTQGFFTLFLEKRYARAADPSRGRFRAFLLGSVQHFLSNERDRAHAQKRGGWTPILPLEFETTEGELRHEPATHATPERVFEHRWALAVVNRVIERLAAEQEHAGRSETFVRLRPYLVSDEPGLQYAELARALNSSQGAIRVAVHRLRRRFRALLLDEIARTVAEPAEIEGEVRCLVAALRAPADHEGWKSHA